MSFENLKGYCMRQGLVCEDTTTEGIPSLKVIFPNRRGAWEHLQRFAVSFNFDYGETFERDAPIIAEMVFFEDIKKPHPLLTQSIIDECPPLYSSEEANDFNPPIIARFFNPLGRGEWLLIEGEEQDGSFLCFGLADILEQELGYWTMEELEELSVSMGLFIQRDDDFKPCRYQDVLK